MNTQLFVITETWGNTKVYYALGHIWVDCITEAHQFTEVLTANEYKSFYRMYDATVETINLQSL